jgi:hypothetical protein
MSNDRSGSLADMTAPLCDVRFTPNSGHYALSSLVTKSTVDRITGAANKTIGVIIAHEIIHDLIHWFANIELLKNGALEIPAATAQVSPD